MQAHPTTHPTRTTRRVTHRIKTALCGLALAACLPLPAQAFCGFYAGKADANLFNEASQVVVVRDGKRTVLSMLNDYKGPLSEFALVVPTPTTLQKGQVRVADKLTFERLDAYSSPRLAEYHDNDPCQVRFDWGQQQMLMRHALPAPMAAAAPSMRAAGEMMRDKALGVTVEAQYTLEEYDIVSLSATQSDGLETWLGENGYKIPKAYINQGMKFFVAKVNLKEQLKTGYTTLRPLQFAFESDKFMLPMRLGMLNAAPEKPQDLIVYLLTKDGRVESSNYRTVKLPANVNLPFFIKPKFQDFYKALFDTQARKEDHRVVFTEYFWDMGWCDPCAANPLTKDELRGAGVFWADGNAQDNFKAMTLPPSPAIKSLLPPNMGGGAQPVVLTRLHVRYTPNTFPEDLMFTQTKDRQNWQTRYVVQNPYDSSVAQCSAKVGQMDCEAMCKPRVAQVLSAPTSEGQSALYRDKDPLALQRDCVSSCVESKRAGIDSAARYYQSDLPKRLDTEKLTLAQLTGWKLSTIDAMPGADRYTGIAISGPQSTAPTGSWWATLFGSKNTQ
nr:DUF2330 domain-containing protein [Rhodoferax sp.]